MIRSVITFLAAWLLYGHLDSLIAQNVYQWIGAPGNSDWIPESNWVQQGSDPPLNKVDFDGIIEFDDGDFSLNTIDDKFPDEIFEIRFNSSQNYSVGSTYYNVGFSAQAFVDSDQQSYTFYNSSIQNIGTGTGTIDFNLFFSYPSIVSYGEIDAINGDLVFNGTVGIPSDSNNNNAVAGFVLYGSNGRTVTFNKSVDGAGKNFSLSGNNLVNLNAADSFSGTTTISGGTLNAAADGSLGSVSSITVGGGGILLLSNSAAIDRVSDTAPIELAGAVIQKASGVTEGTSSSVGLGALALSRDSSIDFTCTTGALSFKTFSPNGHVLSIVNYNSNGSPGGSDQLIFNQDQAENLFSFDFGRGPGVGVTESMVSEGFYEIHPASPLLPQIASVAASSAFTFTSVLGQSYQVNYKDDLSQSGWTALPGYESVSGTGDPIEVTDSDPSLSTLGRRFYQVATTTPGMTCGATNQVSQSVLHHIKLIPKISPPIHTNKNR